MSLPVHPANPMDPMGPMDPALRQQAQITRKRFGIMALPQWALLNFQGPDAVSFLQNRLSNDLLALQPGQGQRNAVLDRQGKIQGILDLYRGASAVWALMDGAEAAQALAQIEKYHILENFQAEDVSGRYAIWAVQGPESTAWLQTLLPEGHSLPSHPFDWQENVPVLGTALTVARRSWLGDDGFLLWLPAQDTPAWEDAFRAACRNGQGSEISGPCWEALRIEAGQPRYGLDYSADTLLPETGLERQTVSYSKGCYLGQETIARVKTYGMLPQALVGLRFSEVLGELPPPGADCFLNGQRVGQLTSVTHSPTFNAPIALAYLGKAERIPGKELLLEIDGQNYAATVCWLPFYPPENQSLGGQELLEEGLRLFSQGQDQVAIEKLRLALQKQPDLLAAYEALGVILSRHEAYEEAIELMNQLLARDPDHVLAHTNLSIFYMKLGDKEKAEDEKAKATMAAFRQKAKEAGLSVDVEAERRKKEQALRERAAMFVEALKFNPDDPLGNFGLGSAYLELQEYDLAIGPLQKTLQAQPKHSVAYASLAKCLAATGQLETARDILNQGIAVAAAKGDLMPLKAMQAHLESLSG